MLKAFFVVLIYFVLAIKRYQCGIVFLSCIADSFVHIRSAAKIVASATNPHLSHFKLRPSLAKDVYTEETA